MSDSVCCWGVIRRIIAPPTTQLNSYGLSKNRRNHKTGAVTNTKTQRYTDPPLADRKIEAQKEPPAILEPPPPRPRAFWFVGRIAVSSALVVSTLLSIGAGVYAFLPNVAVTAISSNESSDPYEANFTITNTGSVPLKNIAVSSTVNQVIFSNGQAVRATEARVYSYLNIEAMSSGESTTAVLAKAIRLFKLTNGNRLVTLGDPTVLQSISFLYTAPCVARPALPDEARRLLPGASELMPISADGTLFVGFTFFGFYKEKRFRFVTQNKKGGSFSWTPASMREPMQESGDRAELLTINRKGASVEDRVGPTAPEPPQACPFTAQ